MNRNKDAGGDPDYRPLGLDLGSLTRAYIGALSKKLEAIPVERYFYVLVLLDDQRRNSPISQQKLAEHFNTDKASMVRMLDYLSENGLIKREVNPEDRREHQVILTRQGENYVPVIREALKELNKDAFKGFTSDEIKSFYCQLYRICENLSALPAHIVQLELKKILK